MSLGSDFASGYNQGLDTSSSSSSSINKSAPMSLYQATLAAHQPMSGHISIGRSKTAKEIMDAAADRALKTQSAQLENQKLEQSIREDRLTAIETRKTQEVNRGLVEQRSNQIRENVSSKKIADADGRVETARGLVTAEDTAYKKKVFDDTLKAVALGDKETVMKYFRDNGTQGIDLNMLTLILMGVFLLKLEIQMLQYSQVNKNLSIRC